MSKSEILEKIKSLESVARRLHTDKLVRKQWFNLLEKYSDGVLEHFDERVTYNIDFSASERILELPIQSQGRSLEECLEIIQQALDEPGLDAASGGHMAYIPGGGLVPSAIGDYLAALSNHFAGIYFSGPGAVRMENYLIRWLCGIIGYPQSAHGNLTSGGSIANLTAIATARDVREVKAKDIPTSVIYVTQQVHHSIQKAIKICGLQECILRYVPVNHRFQMDKESLNEIISKDIVDGLTPFLIVASAGTTNVGAIDPISDISILAKKYQCWLHLDAAYGGFFILAEEVKEELGAMRLADSITINPHKGLFMPYGSGILLVKNADQLEASHHYTASYMQDAATANEERSPANLSPELSKHFRGLRMWLPLQLFGLEPFKAALSEKIWLCRYFYEEVQKIGFRVGPYPELSICIYRYVPEDQDANQFNSRLIQLIRDDGSVFLSSTTIDDVFWLRIAILSFRTHKDTIDTCLKVLSSSVGVLKKNA